MSPCKKTSSHNIPGTRCRKCGPRQEAPSDKRGCRQKATTWAGRADQQPCPSGEPRVERTARHAVASHGERAGTAACEESERSEMIANTRHTHTHTHTHTHIHTCRSHRHSVARLPWRRVWPTGGLREDRREGRGPRLCVGAAIRVSERCLRTPNSRGAKRKEHEACNIPWGPLRQERRRPQGAEREYRYCSGKHVQQDHQATTSRTSRDVYNMSNNIYRVYVDDSRVSRRPDRAERDGRSGAGNSHAIALQQPTRRAAGCLAAMQRALSLYDYVP